MLVTADAAGGAAPASPPEAATADEAEPSQLSQAGLTMGLVVAGLAVVLVCGGGLAFMGFGFWAVQSEPAAEPMAVPGMPEPMPAEDMGKKAKETKTEDPEVLLQRLLDDGTDPVTFL
jgi:hypothetical protein